MRNRRWMVVAAVLLATASALLYLVHYEVFHDLHHIFIYLLGDLAFLPLEVLLVVIVVERVLAYHEKQVMLEKLNMPIGMFFNELGVRLLGQLTDSIEGKDELRPCLAVASDWTRGHYEQVLRAVRRFDYRVDAGRLDLPALRALLAEHRGLLLTLLGNPNLLEHERFTGLLWAIFHLADELAVRKSLDGLPKTDLDHLAGDARRAYALLTVKWLLYCRHLQKAYPYIFSIVARTHPLQEHPDPTVR